MVIEAMFTLTEEFLVHSFLKMLLKPFCKPDLVIIWPKQPGRSTNRALIGRQWRKCYKCGFRQIGGRKWSLRSDLGFNKDLTRGRGGIQARLLRSGPPTGTRMNVLQATDAPIWLESLTPIKSSTSCSYFPNGPVRPSVRDFEQCRQAGERWKGSRLSGDSSWPQLPLNPSRP